MVLREQVKAGISQAKLVEKDKGAREEYREL